MTKNAQNDDHAELERLTTKQLQARLKKLTGKATKSNNRKNLIKRCVAATENPPAEAAKPKPHKTRRQLKPGTSLTKTHKGVEIIINVTDDGYEWDGITYSSLSRVAKAIAGYHVSGPAFFKIPSE